MLSTNALALLFRWCFLTQATLAVVVSVFAAQLPGAQSVTRRPPGRPTPKTARLTPQQKLGLQLLGSAESEAFGLQPDMRGFVLWQISHGYQRTHSVKAKSLLKDAFRATLSIEASGTGSEGCSEVELCGVKDWLQKHILRELIDSSWQLDYVQVLLAQAEPDVRELMRMEFLAHYIKTGELEKAREILSGFADQEYPYDAATQLMLAIPPQHLEERLAIFSQAVDSFKQQSDESHPPFDGLCTLVFRFWRDLPAPIVLDAIDQILDRAKQVDEAEKDFRIGISGSKGDAYFASQYAFRLFQLMPALQQLDGPRADNLLRGDNELQAAMQTYPQGMVSVDPEFYNRPPVVRGDMLGLQGVRAFSTDARTEAAAEQLNDELVRRQEQIFMEAEKKPREALVDAMRMPMSDPYSEFSSVRANTLHSLARIAAKRDPLVTRTAIQEMRSLVDDMTLRSQAQFLADLPDQTPAACVSGCRGVLVANPETIPATCVSR